MILDFDTSTVTIAGRRFPAVCAICPPADDGKDPGSDLERMLGGRGGPGIANIPISDQVFIPCENGVIVGIEEHEDRPYFEVTLHSRACQRQPWDDTHIWLPYFLAVIHGELVVARPPRSVWRWDGAEPEWTVELIDRVGRMPFIQPGGPEVRLTPITPALFASIPPLVAK